jgi:hypothetical protein
MADVLCLLGPGIGGLAALAILFVIFLIVMVGVMWVDSQMSAGMKEGIGQFVCLGLVVAAVLLFGRMIWKGVCCG